MRNLSRSAIYLLLPLTLLGHEAFADFDQEVESLLHLIDALPARIASLSGGATSCSPPTVNLFDRTTFASFACRAPSDSVDHWIKSQQDLDLDLLMICGHCNGSGLARVIAQARGGESTPAEVSADLPEESRWRIGTSTISAERLRGGADLSSCLVSQASYTAGSRSLEYLGTHHFYTLSSPAERTQMIQTLEAVFAEASPQEVVLEGYPDHFPCERAIELYLSNRDELTSEQDVVAWLALRNGTRIRGAEPPNSGLVGPNVPGLRVLQRIAQMTGPSPHDLPPQDVLIESVFSSLRLEMGTDFPFSTVAMFLEWYQSFNGRRFDPANAYQDITPAPFLPRDVEARPSNIAYHEASVRRDNHALQNLRSAMSRSDRVMAVYGSGHLERTAPTLSSLLTPRTPVARCRD